MRLRLPSLSTQGVFFAVPLIVVLLLSFYPPFAGLSTGLAIVCITFFSLVNAICAIFADNLKTYFLTSSFFFLAYLGLAALFLYSYLVEHSFGFWAIFLLFILYGSLWLMAIFLRQFLMRSKHY
jgi:hypothetical protein